MGRAWERALVVLALVACSGPDEVARDALPADTSPPSPTCGQLVRAWTDAVSASAACVRDTDCGEVEPAFRDSCNGIPSLSAGCGTAVNVSAYEAAGGPAIATAAHEAGCATRMFDCGPSDELACTEGYCTLRFTSCLPDPPDASPLDAAIDAPEQPDATVADAF